MSPLRAMLNGHRGPSFFQTTIQRKQTTLNGARGFSQTSRCRRDQPQNPPSSSHGLFYKDFARPVGKVFLGAVFTYQVLYWVWTKLEMDEIRAEKSSQLASLEHEVRSLVQQPTQTKTRS